MNKALLYSAIDEERYMEVNVRFHLIAAFRDDLKKCGFITSRQLRYKKNGDFVKVAGRLVLFQTPPTRSGRRIMFFTIEDEYGLIDLTMFPEEQRLYAKKILSSVIVLCAGRVRRLGIRDVSVIVSKVFDVREICKRRNKAEDKRFTA